MMMKPLLNGASVAAFFLLANFAAAQMTFSLDKASYGAGEDNNSTNYVHRASTAHGSRVGWKQEYSEVHDW